MSDDAPTPDLAPETLEGLQTRHRKEQRDLISRITQKKKQATKKTRKGVNDECERLERELKEQQEGELAALNGDTIDAAPEDDDDASETSTPDAQEQLASLSLSTPSQTPSQTPSTNGDTPTPAQKKPNRAKARLARRAAETASLVAAAEEEAAKAPNPREIEREHMAQQLQTRKLALHEIRADGHCLYAAVADQLSARDLGLTPRIPIILANTEANGNDGVQAYQTVRIAAADFITQHSESFEGFMEDPLQEHVRKIRETGEWGGHLELLALARVYGVRICVLHSDGRVDKIEPAEDNSGKEAEVQEIWLGYFKHSHGLGEHYNSLRKIG